MSIVLQIISSYYITFLLISHKDLVQPLCSLTLSLPECRLVSRHDIPNIQSRIVGQEAYFNERLYLCLGSVTRSDGKDCPNVIAVGQFQCLLITVLHMCV